MSRPLALALGLAPLILPLAAMAQDAPGEPRRPSLQVLESIIETREPETRIEAVDHDRISARRIDIVDADHSLIDTVTYGEAVGVGC